MSLPIPGVWDPDGYLLPRRPRIIVVLDEHDGPHAAAHLRRIGGIDAGRVVVRPTPAVASLPAFALDVLAALEKNPVALQRKTRTGWRHARAWLAAARPTDLVIDRAHLLPYALLLAAAHAAAENDATLWLIWAGATDPHPAIAALKAAGHETDTRHISELPHDLPAVPRHQPRAAPKPTAARPMLPAADFPLFLAHARRRLTDDAFKRLATRYGTATFHTQQWLTSTPAQAGLVPGGALDPVALIRWLREQQIGPQRSGYEALITLRATQAVLARVGILLAWDRSGLGPLPENRLPSILTSPLVRALGTLPRTEDALATALALHLEQDGGCFVCWNLADVETSTLTLHPPAEHRHVQPKTERIATLPSQERTDAAARLEIPCRHPVTLPTDTDRILRAHLARRRMDGAGPGDPLFPALGRLSPATTVAQAIRRGTRHVGCDPWWLDRERVRARRPGPRLITSSWMTERALSLEPIPHPKQAR